MTTRRPSKLWRPTGWHIGTGTIIRWEISLPSGIRATVWRDAVHLDWNWEVEGARQDTLRQSMVRCTDAKRMAEEYLVRHVRKALRLLRP